jgi:nickel-dependent lactate racemase
MKGVNKAIEKYLVIPHSNRLRTIPVERIKIGIKESLHKFLDSHKKARNITLCLTDNTRPFPDKKLLPTILDCIVKQGFDRENITIFIATGLHRHLSKEELREKLGSSIRFRVLQNNPEEAIEVRSGGENFYINPVLMRSDLLLGAGIFEPHQYAGFSGGNKIFIIGCGGRRTIEYTHSPHMILSKGVKIGNVFKNPFRGCIERYAKRLPPRWVINIVKDDRGDIVMFDCGEPGVVFNRLSEWYIENMSLSFPSQFDGVLINIDRNKGVNLYQASRGATYLSLSKSPVVKKGAPIIVYADLREGIGLGSGEEEFERIMKSNLRNHRLIERLSKVGYGGGGQRALIFLKTLMRNPVIFTGYIKDISIERENLYFIRDLREAVEYVITSYRARKLLYIHNPFVYLYSVKKGFERGI